MEMTTQPVAPLSGPIGVFDSGFGGLTVLREIRKALPQLLRTSFSCLFH